MTADELAAWAKAEQKKMEDSRERDQKAVESWYEITDQVRDPQALLVFFDKLNEFSQNYNTVPNALAAGALATAKMLDRWLRNGGITGFQAGFVMWEFVRRWLHIEGPVQLVQYRDMLYPQYADKFAKTIDQETWVQEQAKKLLEKDGEISSQNDYFTEHLKSIVAGTPPFGYQVVDRR